MTPRQKAEACYEIARRPTTNPNEAANAIGRGDAICDRYGLDKATFDVPGRAKPRVEARFERARFSYARHHEYGARMRPNPADDLFEQMARNMGEGQAWAEALRRFAHAAGHDPDEVERARQAQAYARDRAEAIRREEEARAVRRKRAEAQQAADMLIKRGFVVEAVHHGIHMVGLTSWSVTYRGRTEYATDDQLLALWGKVKDREVEQAQERFRRDEASRWAGREWDE